MTASSLRQTLCVLTAGLLTTACGLAPLAAQEVPATPPLTQSEQTATPAQEPATQETAAAKTATSQPETSEAPPAASQPAAPANPQPAQPPADAAPAATVPATDTVAQPAPAAPQPVTPATQPLVTSPALNPVQPTPGLNVPATSRSTASSYRPNVALQRYLWEYPLPGFSEPDYLAGVKALFDAYEQADGKKLVPGPKGRVAIKLYTDSGPGLMTPPALTRAVIATLKERGFTESQIVLVGLREENLRACGYLPAIGAEDQSPFFGGVRVYALDNGAFFNRLWFYDSNLPSRAALANAAQRRDDLFNYQPNPEERKSYLNTLLFLDTDFWINLPVAADNAALGISGALANASLWNISNNERFFDSPANAPVAAAEISAIPELRDTWALNILSLETYQYLGGPRFNAVYTGRERRLWMSANPVAIDYLMWQRFKPLRTRYGYPENSPEPPLFQYASSLGLGSYNVAELLLRRLPSADGTEAAE